MLKFLRLAAALAACGGCTARPLLERAIEARGGPLHGLVLDAETRVHAGAPGIWRYTRAYLAPDHYGWKIETEDEPICHLFDGAVAASFVGDEEVGRDPSPAAPLRTHARWTAAVNLDALAASGVVVAPLGAADLPEGVREGLCATFPDGAAYRLGFDRRTLLVWARGPLDLSPVAKGEAAARFSDYRRVGPLLLSFATSYAFDGRTLADEKVVAACVDPPTLTAASFAHPSRLPDCP